MTDSPLTLLHTLTNGVYVVGVAHGGCQDGFTAAWITQVSFDPVLLALSISREHASYPLLKGSGCFTVNVLREDQLELARHFGTQSGRDVEKLSQTRWNPSPLGAPILLDALAYLECRMTEAFATGDHELVVGQVIGGMVLAPDARPLRYADTGNMDGSEAVFPGDFKVARSI